MPWTEPGSQFTAMFEALAIDWLQQASVTAVSKHLRISWDEASGIMERAVRRGLKRREAEVVRYVGVDETSFAKRQAYVTVVANLERSRVLCVADDRPQPALDGYGAGLSHEHLVAIEAVAMEMCAPYITSTWPSMTCRAGACGHSSMAPSRPARAACRGMAVMPTAGRSAAASISRDFFARTPSGRPGSP